MPSRTRNARTPTPVVFIREDYGSSRGDCREARLRATVKLDLAAASRHYLVVYIMPLTVPQKVGVVFYGLAIGVCALVATTVAAVILSFLVCVFLTVAHLASNDGGAAFLILQAAIYGFYAGIVVGMIVCWRVCRSRLRGVPTE